MTPPTRRIRAQTSLSPLPEGWGRSGNKRLLLDRGGAEAAGEGQGRHGHRGQVKDIDKIIVAGDGVASTLGALGLKDNNIAAAPRTRRPRRGLGRRSTSNSRRNGVEGLLATERYPLHRRRAVMVLRRRAVP